MTNILIVDDHPITIQGYEFSLENLKNKYQIKIDSAICCDSVISKMNEFKDNFFDIVLLDIKLPPSKSKTFISGEDLGFSIRQQFPKTKIIVHTGLNSLQRITNVFNTLNPDGFLIKSDIDRKVLELAVTAVMKNRNYYSEKIKKLLSPDDFDEIYIDPLNRKILYHISQGNKMKDLPFHIPLSMPTIERRKKRIKHLLGVPNGSNKDMLDIARKKGFI
jgi:DNA-binding NarL/FixJ family response regulator